MTDHPHAEAAQGFAHVGAEQLKAWEAEGRLHVCVKGEDRAQCRRCVDEAAMVLHRKNRVFEIEMEARYGF
jgi:hypothetical protein